MALSFIGIILGVAAFVFLAFRGTTILVSSLSATLIISVFSGLNILDVLNDVWLSSFGGFMKSVFIIFAFSALFGRVMTDSGASKSIAAAFSSLIDKSKNKKFVAALVVPAFYVVLCYAGISAFVAVFTALAVGSEILRKYDVPWRFYCYGGTSMVATLMLGGSLQLTNVLAGQITGTNSLTAGMGLGMVAGVTYLLVVVILIYFDIKGAEKRGEGFSASGQAFLDAEIPLGSKDEDLPPFLLSILPLAVVIAGCTVFNLNVVVALFMAIALCFVIFFKRLSAKNINTVLTNGLTAAFVPVTNVAATAAVAYVISAAPGFAVIATTLNKLPPLIAGVSLTSLVTFIVAGGEAALNGFGPQIFASFTSAGLSPALAHRMMCISCFSGASPHSAAIINATALARIDYKKGLLIYLKGCWLGGLAAVAVSILCIELGIFA